MKIYGCLGGCEPGAAPALVSQGEGWGGLAGTFVMAVVSLPLMTGMALQMGMEPELGPSCSLQLCLG